MSDPKLNILVAYPYFKPQIIEELMAYKRDRFRLIVDSGAFSAWNKGINIELHDYCNFLEKISFLRPFNAVQLDVFGDPEASYKNLLEMRERGFTDIMPVFTRGDSLEKLEEYYTMTDYIMFGGIVIGGQNKNYVKWFLEHNKGRHCHWLGFVNMPFIKHYKPYSVDSSSWIGAARFGKLHVYDGQGDLLYVRKPVFAKAPDSRILAGLKRIGIKPEEITLLRHKEAWVFDGKPPKYFGERVRSTANLMGTMSHVVRMYEVEKKLGTKIYLAIVNVYQLRTLFKATEILVDRGIIKL